MRIVFAGDSITDAGSYRKPVEEFTGYVKYIAEELGDKHQYFNRGISGNRVVDVLNRYEKDIFAEKPDILTLLIGINDVWRYFDSNLYTSPQEFSGYIREILTKARKDFPNVKIIVLEPFLIPEPSRESWRPLLSQIIQEVRYAAVDLADDFVPLDGLFAYENMTIESKKLSADGVHPAEEGQKVLAKYLLKSLKKFI